MVRIEEEDGWMLLTHPHHAELAGLFANHWGNELFPRPEPFELIQIGVARHDDAWADRDANPELTLEGDPSAFSKELVGTYDAFEEIDFEDYLKVRASATEAVASEKPLSAALISMHTYNLLTEQVDHDSLTEEQKGMLEKFLKHQKLRQMELIKQSNETEGTADQTSQENMERAFKFLQCCDNLSLVACVRFPKEIGLRHEHPTNDGRELGIKCIPHGDDRYQLDPYPFLESEVTFEVPFKKVFQKEFSSQDEFRKLYSEADEQSFTVTIFK